MIQVIYLDLEQAVSDGIPFYVSQNNVNSPNNPDSPLR